MNNLKLFPYILMRLCGDSFNRLESLNIIETNKTLKDILNKKRDITICTNVICEGLYELISKTSDSKIQNNLLNFKRAIYNNREVTDEKFKLVESLLSNSLKSRYYENKKMNDEVIRLSLTFREFYKKELHISRANLKEMATKEILQKGLLLSSQSLLKRINKYTHKNSLNLVKEDFRTEQSIIKYISRLYAKTSPFSTFTNLMLCHESEISRFSSNNIVNSVVSIEEMKVKSHIRLNNLLYQYLKALLFKNNKINSKFLLRPNPALKKENNFYVFLTNFYNLEAFQRIEANPVIDVFVTLASENPQGIKADDLISKILSKGYIDASKSEIMEYIVQLTEYGLLEFNLGVSGSDPNWDIKLTKTLTLLDGGITLINNLISVLKLLRASAEEYSVSDVSRRQIILVESYESFKRICMKLHEDAGLPELERKPIDEIRRIKQAEKNLMDKETVTKPGEEIENVDNEVFKKPGGTFFKYKPEHIFYEDTTCNAVLPFNNEEIYPFIKLYNDLLLNIDFLEWDLDEKYKMSYYFIEKYGAEASIDILKFYEDYYRDFKKPETERNRQKIKQAKENIKENQNKREDKKSSVEDVDIPIIKERRDSTEIWLKTFSNLIAENTMKENDEVNFYLDDVIKVNKLIFNKSANENTSSSAAFLQFFLDKENNLKAVVNASLIGFGKYYGRFMHLFDNSVTTKLQQMNKEVALAQCILAEDCDGSHFSANIHPPLMPYEIWFPGSQNSLPPDKQIPITDLELKFDKTSNFLKLFHKISKKQVLVFDLGFQGYAGRSQLFLLLQRFTLVKQVFTNSLTDAITKKYNEVNRTNGFNMDSLNNVTWINPRIVYENKLVIQRKTWFIPKSKLPFRSNSEKDEDYFLKINEWRITEGIPEEVFVFIFLNRALINEIKPEDALKFSHDDYKPQYISFKNPFLVNLFGKLTEKIPSSLKIEEMLPNSSQLSKINNKKYVSEHLIQWYNYKIEKMK